MTNGRRPGSTVDPPERAGGGTFLRRTFEDGTTQTTLVAPDGSMSRVTERVNPSTGATITVSQGPDGTTERTELLPGGSMTRVTTYPDGSTERGEIIRNEDGSDVSTSTDRDGRVTTTRRFEGPDGTLFEVKTLPDGLTETRTSKQTVQPDGSVVNETTGPEGSSRGISSADGSRSELVFTRADGKQETSVIENLPDGSTVTITTDADGRRETVRKETLPDGGEREVVTRHDGSTETTLTTRTTNSDGSITVQIESPGSTGRMTSWPDGSVDNSVQHSDGTHERSASGRRSDGSQWHHREDRDGTWEHIEQPPPGNRTTVTRSDGTRVEHTVGDRINIVTHRPDGSVELTNVDLDGGGTTTVTGPDGALVSETVHEPQPIEAYPDLSPPEAGLVLHDALVDALDGRGVVGPRDAPEPTAAALTDDVVEPVMTAGPNTTGQPPSGTVHDIVLGEDNGVGVPTVAAHPEIAVAAPQVAPDPGEPQPQVVEVPELDREMDDTVTAPAEEPTSPPASTPDFDDGDPAPVADPTLAVD